jgi:putative oxidoreductase
LNSVTATDIGLLVLRLSLGLVLVAHGYNHIYGGGKIAGSARWFESLGMRPGLLHAWTASLAELGAGMLLVLGFLTPLAAAGLIGVMVVAWITNHLKNGFFIFRPGEGYEYVMTLSCCGFTLTGTGAGRVSIDKALDIFQPPGWWGMALGIAIGLVGAAGLLVLFWRPNIQAGKPAADATANGTILG